MEYENTTVGPATGQFHWFLIDPQSQNMKPYRTGIALEMTTEEGASLRMPWPLKWIAKV